MNNATTTTAKKTITVNGTQRPVLQALSSGPGCAHHTYRIHGSWVTEIGGRWTVQRDGQFAVPCEVSAA